jgi:hypothetical protein
MLKHNITNTLATNVWTLEFWFVATAEGEMDLMNTRFGSAQNSRIIVNCSSTFQQVRALFRASGGSAAWNNFDLPIGTLNRNVLHHLAITSTADKTLRCWINGVNRGTVTSSVTFYGASDIVTLGSMDPSTTSAVGCFTGTLHACVLTAATKYTQAFVPTRDIPFAGQPFFFASSPSTLTTTNLPWLHTFYVSPTGPTLPPTVEVLDTFFA